MDNPPAHKRSGVRETIEATGGRLLYLLSYSPDFNPIEMAFAKLKALLRKAAMRTIPLLWDTPQRLLPVGMPALPPPCRICLNLSGKCSKWAYP